MVKTSKFCNSELNRPVTLASTSPRRKELLSSLVRKFEVVAPSVDESAITAVTPRKLVQKLAEAKADEAYARFNLEGRTIIAADTLVCRGKVFGKPENFAAAVDTLMRLNGKWHKVYTGVCIISADKKLCFVDCSKVKFNNLRRDEIENYVETYKPFDKAGAYAIQDNCIVERYKGSYSNIVGLPLEKLAAALNMEKVSNEHS